LGQHVVRLRPAPHSRTPILAYSLTVQPAKHFIGTVKLTNGCENISTLRLDGRIICRLMGAIQGLKMAPIISHSGKAPCSFRR
jgi:hypothetical protein